MKPLARNISAAAMAAAVALVAPRAAGQEEEAEPATGMGALAKIVPLGKTHKDIIYPSFEGGALASVMTAKTATRNNDEFLDLTSLTIELFEGGVPSFDILLRTAAYYLEAKTLTSDEHTVIKGKTFTISGDGMVFDTESGQGQLEGNIRMVIEDFSEFAPDAAGLEGKPVEPPPAGDEEPVAEAPAPETP